MGVSVLGYVARYNEFHNTESESESDHSRQKVHKMSYEIPLSQQQILPNSLWLQR